MTEVEKNASNAEKHIVPHKHGIISVWSMLMLAAAYCLMPLLTDRGQCYNRQDKLIWSALLTIKLVKEFLALNRN
jgi:cbb3-type cytochrome oxidase subunit 1